MAVTVAVVGIAVVSWVALAAVLPLGFSPAGVALALLPIVIFGGMRVWYGYADEREQGVGRLRSLGRGLRDAKDWISDD